jgi:hypothetical protein
MFIYIAQLETHINVMPTVVNLLRERKLGAELPQFLAHTIAGQFGKCELDDGPVNMNRSINERKVTMKAEPSCQHEHVLSVHPEENEQCQFR